MTVPPAQAPPRPAISIYRELVGRHGAVEVSYQMVRAYVGRRRAVIRRQSLSPAHQAVSDHDLNRLRDLLNDGHDIEDDSGDGCSLLRRAIHAEADRHARTGEPLHADMTALPGPPHQLLRRRLLSRRLRPFLLRRHNVKCRAHHGTSPAEHQARRSGPENTVI